MRRALFVIGVAMVLGALGMLGYALYAKQLSDSLVHVLGAVAGSGLIIAALMVDPKTVLSLADKVLAFRRGGAGPTSTGSDS